MIILVCARLSTIERNGDVCMLGSKSKSIYYYDWACEFVNGTVVANNIGDELYSDAGCVSKHVCVRGSLSFMNKDDTVPICHLNLKEVVYGDREDDICLSIYTLSNGDDTVEYNAIYAVSRDFHFHTEMGKVEIVRHTVDDTLQKFSEACEALTEDERAAVMSAAKVVARELKKRWLFTFALRNNGRKRGNLTQ